MRWINHPVFIPVWLFAISIAGLVTALLGDGVWNWLAWLCLLIPLCYGLTVLKKGISKNEQR